MNFNEVTILQFQKLNAASKHFEGNAYEIGMAIFEIFENIPKSISSQWLVKDFDKKLAKYRFLIDAKMKDDEWVKSFELNGKTYKVTQQTHHWTTEQWINMGALCKDTDKLIDNVHLIVATLCTDERELRDRAEEFQEHLSIEIAYPIAVFFCAVMLAFQKVMPSYFQEEEFQIGSQRSGVGMMLSLNWWVLKIKINCYKNRFMSFLTTWLTSKIKKLLKKKKNE